MSGLIGCRAVVIFSRVKGVEWVLGGVAGHGEGFRGWSVKNPRLSTILRSMFSVAK